MAPLGPPRQQLPSHPKPQSRTNPIHPPPPPRQSLPRLPPDAEPMSRPPKPSPTSEEVDLAHTMREAGSGWPSIAAAISEGRDAHKAATAEVRRKRTVSARWVQRRIFGKTLTSAKPSDLRRAQNLKQNQKQTGNSGIRDTPKETPDDFLQGPVKESPQPSGKVEVASGGSKA